jgi:hypothetical protein
MSGGGPGGISIDDSKGPDAFDRRRFDEEKGRSRYAAPADLRKRTMQDEAPHIQKRLVKTKKGEL